MIWKNSTKTISIPICNKTAMIHQPRINRTSMKIRTINKKELCILFGLYAQKSNRAYYSLLKKRYFTPQALKEMGISEQEFDSVKCGRHFNYDQTRRIIQHFNVTEDEMEGI